MEIGVAVVRRQNFRAGREMWRSWKCLIIKHNMHIFLCSFISYLLQVLTPWSFTPRWIPGIAFTWRFEWYVLYPKAAQPKTRTSVSVGLVSSKILLQCSFKSWIRDFDLGAYVVFYFMRPVFRPESHLFQNVTGSKIFRLIFSPNGLLCEVYGLVDALNAAWMGLYSVLPSVCRLTILFKDRSGMSSRKEYAKNIEDTFFKKKTLYMCVSKILIRKSTKIVLAFNTDGKRSTSIWVRNFDSKFGGFKMCPKWFLVSLSSNTRETWLKRFWNRYDSCRHFWIHI